MNERLTFIILNKNLDIPSPWKTSVTLSNNTNDFF